MAQMAKADALSLIPTTCVVEEERIPPGCPLTSTHAMWHPCMPTPLNTVIRVPQCQMSWAGLS